MRVGPTTPIVPIVVSPALNGAVMSEASHSPVDGCSAPIVTFSSACDGADVGEHAQHLLLALERLEQPAERLATHLLRLVGEVRHAAHHHVGRALPLGRDPQRLRGMQEQVALAVRRPSAASCSSRACASR